MSAVGFAQPVSTGYRAVMWWGGLRGAVSLALALAVLESPTFSDETRQFVGLLVTAFVLFTLFVNATTIRFLMRFFGLDKLSGTELAVRDRAMCEALAQIGTNLEDLGDVRGMEKKAIGDVSADYGHRAQAARAAAATHALTDDEWLRVGLRVTANRERKSYLDFFSDGLVSVDVARTLLAQVEDLQDCVKARGIEGYRDTVVQQLGFSTRFRIALDTQSHTGWQAPLARELAHRFEILNATTLALAALLQKNWKTTTALLPETAASEARAVINDRLTQTERALDALTLQYPEYSRAIQLRDLGVVGMRLEQNSYDRMLNEAIISHEVHDDLMKGLTTRRTALETRPTLDLGLDASSLLDKVPFFTDLDPELKALCAKLLRPQLALPGEKILSKGDAGHAMYFLSSGAVTVDVPGKPVHLGNGEFFGEIALVSDQPRNADVVAQCYCQLLALYRDDFQVVLRQHPELKKTVEGIADQRARETRQLSGED
jgi:CPA1 family monovalent cation:H+ antiporter